MNRNKFAVWAAVALMVCGALALHWTAPAEIVAHRQAGQIDGNSQLLPAPSAYTIVALPADYKSDQLSQAYLSGFASNPTLRELRAKTQLTTYADGHPDFEWRWQNRIPEVSQGKPVILVMDGEQVAYKASGKPVKTVVKEVKQVMERLRPRPDRPDCPLRPKPDDTPDDVPDEPAIPDSPPIPDTPPDAIVDEEADPLHVVVAAIVGGFVGWLIMFRRKM